jgi:transposase
MSVRKRKLDRCGRPPLRSPGRPSVAARAERQLFWTFIATGMSSDVAARQGGVSQPVGTRWFREAGGMPPAMFRPAAKPLSGRYLSLTEREVIALLLVQGHSLRDIGHRLGRSASTISREVRLGELDAVVGQDRVDAVGYGFEQMLEELPGRSPVSLVDQLGDRELAGAVDADEQVELAFGGLHLGDVDVEEADRVTLEELPLGFVALDVRQTGDAVSLEAAV